MTQTLPASPELARHYFSEKRARNTESWILNLELHVAAITRSTFHQPFLSDSAQAIIPVFITSRLDCCNALYTELALKTGWKLHLMQNVVAHLLNGVGCQKHIAPVLQSLHGLPVAFFAQVKVLALTYRALMALHT